MSLFTYFAASPSNDIPVVDFCADDFVRSVRDHRLVYASDQRKYRMGATDEHLI